METTKPQQTEDEIIIELKEKKKESIKRLELLIQVLKGGKHKEINDLVVKYAELEGKTPVQFYQEFMKDLEFLSEYYKSENKLFSSDKVAKEKAKQEFLRVAEFEKKYVEIVRFDVFTLSKIPTISETVNNSAVEALEPQK